MNKIEQFQEIMKLLMEAANNGQKEIIYANKLYENLFLMLIYHGYKVTEQENITVIKWE